MKSVMYIAIAFLYLTSCTWSGVRTPSSDTPKPRHIVITLHGVRGNDESYGKFHDIIKGNLEKLDSAFAVENYNWTYPVGKAVEVSASGNGRTSGKIWTPHEISKKFNEDFFLNDKSATHLKELGPNDKISIIAYSMGGLMAMSWYYDTMFNFKHVEAGEKLQYTDENHTKLLSYLEKVKNVIGLGAVYWGSLDAELGWTFLEKGSLTHINKAIPKIQNLCQTKEFKAISASASNQTTEMSVGKSVALTCNAVETLTNAKTKLNEFSNAMDDAVARAKDSLASKGLAIPDNWHIAMPSMLTVPGWNDLNVKLSAIKAGMTSVGNVSPHELNNMRLTSDVINEMRIARIWHVKNSTKLGRFNAKWTNIVGVFPCLGKSDNGLTCNDFKLPDYKKVNDGFKMIFSGLNRRETDGPVLSPSAVADFIYYSEPEGQETKDITAAEFVDTKEKQTQNNDIFVENMHATVTPALESLTGILQPLGLKLATGIKGFDLKLGEDVVVISDTCKDPMTCKHPNYKHILQTLGNCEAGSQTCSNAAFMNQYYNVENENERLTENKKLKNELGSFVLSMNIYLPANSKVSEMTSDQILENFKFNFANATDLKDPFSDNLLNLDGNFAVQIARKNEIMSSFATVKTYSNLQLLRVFFIGRAWDKANMKNAEALANGVNIDFDIQIPGVKARRVSAKVKPTYTTYINMHMK